MNGIALTVLLSQVPKLFGFSVTAERPVAPSVGNRRQGAPRATRTSRRSRSAPATLAAHTATEALAARPRHIDRRGRRHRCSRGLRPRNACRRIRARSSATGIALATLPCCPRRRPGADPHGRPRGRPRLVRGHERAFSNLCGASAHTCRPEPGNGRPRRRQSRRSLLSGLPHQQQLIAHTGGRGGGRQDAADRRRRCARHRAAAGVRARRCSSICHTLPWLPSSSPRPSAWSKCPTCAASIASSAGSSGFRWSASRVWPCSAPFRALRSRS